MTWLFGALAISSAFIIVGWSKALRRNWSPPTLWNTRMLVTLSMVLHSIAIFGFTTQRTYDLFRGYNFDGSNQAWVVAALGALLASKVALIWAAALWRQDRVVGWSWWFYLASIAAWTVFLQTEQV